MDEWLKVRIENWPFSEGPWIPISVCTVYIP